MPFNETTMVVNLVIGTQWGDEGKGKIVDYYSKDANYVIRYHGGNNAGHTIKVGKEVYKLHIIPSGAIQGKIGIIGNGVVVDPEVLLNEINELTNRGIIPKLLISDRANIIMPYHKILDGAEEKYLKDKKIGTTKKGIGPCYSDKISRNGIRAADLIDKDALSKKLDIIIPIKKKVFEVYKIKEKIDKDEILKTYLKFGESLKNYITSTHLVINKAINSGKNILFEGAQGTMLDVDFGAYTTRVGEGPLPTEQINEIGKHLQTIGGEFGATTGRLRRCGWLDLVVVNHSCMISGINTLAITKLDVLDGLKTIKICIKYDLNGNKIDYFPANIEDVKKCKPIYKEFKGWNKISIKSNKFTDLPKEAQYYVKFIEKKLKIPISIVSIGPGRTETIEV